MANVRFYFGAQAKYDALVEKNPIALYFIEDTQRLYKGDVLMATGADATALAAGLMSAADKEKLDSLTVDGGIRKLTAVDGTIVMTDTEDGGKSIGVAISSKEGNSLVAVEGGLFVPTAQEVSVPEYAIEKQEVAEDGYATSYKLKRSVNGESTYVGDTINIAKDMVLQGATLEVVAESDVPYVGAIVGDPYIDMVFNDAAESHIYIPVKGLVDTYTAGDGIEIVDGKISVKIADNANGLQFVDGAMSIALATSTSAGALSAVDKVALDNLVALDIENKFATKEELKVVEDAVLAIPAPNAEQFTIENNVFSIKDLNADNIMYNGKKLSDILAERESAYTWEELGSEVTVDLASDDVNSIIKNAEDNTVVTLNSGSVNSVLNVTSSITLEGANAGVAQNFDQEV